MPKLIVGIDQYSCDSYSMPNLDLAMEITKTKGILQSSLSYVLKNIQLSDYSLFSKHFCTF